MMIGASTANLYPMETEESLAQLVQAGFRRLEVFINTESEATPTYARELRERAQAYGAQIVAMHPYTSAFEPYLLYSAYIRRFEDGLKVYGQLFEAAAAMGASYVNMHGDRVESVLPEEESIRRYEQLYDLGQTYGVTLLQENVLRYRASSVNFIRSMRRLIGDKAQFTFDSKQCARCGLKPVEVLDAMGQGLRHVHISDQNEHQDCLVPGKGNVDYDQLMAIMQQYGFSGDWMIELYRCNFSSVNQLVEGKNLLQKALKL